MRSPKPTPVFPTPVFPTPVFIAVSICDRCGDVCVGGTPCRCRTPYDETEVRRRHRDAVARARKSTTQRRGRRDAFPAA
jgi:hypothetical protein